MTRVSPIALAGVAFLVLLPFAIKTFFGGSERYYLHLAIQMLIWSFIYTGWSIMGRFGLVSLGHGAFTGIGAYGCVLLWNYFGLTPWIGIPISVVLAVLVALVVGYPCFRRRITGHYFALLTLALTEFVRLCIVGLRDYTGGSLGTQPRRYDDGLSLYAMQFEPDRVLSFYVALALWLAGLLVWRWVDRSMDRFALEATSEDEDAAASVGIGVTRVKLKVTAISAAMCAVGGAIYGQYQMYIGPDTIAGLSVSLNIVFAVISGGLYVLLGPTVGAVFTQVLSEVLRVDDPGVDRVAVPARLGGAGARYARLWFPARVLHHLHAKGDSWYATRTPFARCCRRNEAITPANTCHLSEELPLSYAARAALGRSTIRPRPGCPTSVPFSKTISPRAIVVTGQPVTSKPSHGV